MTTLSDPLALLRSRGYIVLAVRLVKRDTPARTQTHTNPSPRSPYRKHHPPRRKPRNRGGSPRPEKLNPDFRHQAHHPMTVPFTYERRCGLAMTALAVPAGAAP